MKNKHGTATPMPVTGAACGIKPSKEAMEVDFSIDFSNAKQLLIDSKNENNNTADKSTPKTPSGS